MSRRLVFVFGHLSGLVIGLTLAWAYFENSRMANQSAASLPNNPPVVPVSFPILPGVPHHQPIPDGWELRKFNGHSFYIIPVENDDSQESI